LDKTPPALDIRVFTLFKWRFQLKPKYFRLYLGEMLW